MRALWHLPTCSGHCTCWCAARGARFKQLCQWQHRRRVKCGAAWHGGVVQWQWCGVVQCTLRCSVLGLYCLHFVVLPAVHCVAAGSSRAWCGVVQLVCLRCCQACIACLAWCWAVAGRGHRVAWSNWCACVAVRLVLPALRGAAHCHSALCCCLPTVHCVAAGSSRAWCGVAQLVCLRCCQACIACLALLLAKCLQKLTMWCCPLCTVLLLAGAGVERAARAPVNLHV